MELNTLALFKMVNSKDLVSMNIIMEISMKESLIKISLKVKEYINILMEEFMKVSGRVINKMEKVNWRGQMERSILGNFLMANYKVKELWNILQV